MAKKQRTQNKRTLKRRTRNRKGGKKTGLIETAAVPFGLFAVQHLLSRKSGKHGKKMKKLYKKRTMKFSKKKN